MGNPYGINLDRSTIGAHLVEIFLAPTAFVLLLLALFIMYLGYKSRQYAKLEEDCPCLLEDAEQVSIFWDSKKSHHRGDVRMGKTGTIASVDFENFNKVEPIL